MLRLVPYSKLFEEYEHVTFACFSVSFSVSRKVLKYFFGALWLATDYGLLGHLERVLLRTRKTTG